MKTLNTQISDETYKNLSNYKVDKKLKTLGDALDKMVKEFKEKK